MKFKKLGILLAAISLFAACKDYHSSNFQNNHDGRPIIVEKNAEYETKNYYIDGKQTSSYSKLNKNPALKKPSAKSRIFNKLSKSKSYSRKRK